MTNSLEIRRAQHRDGVARGFAWRNNTHALVYYENFPEPAMAIAREKQLKRWTRRKKELLIERLNPEWRDLSIELFPNQANEVAGATRGSSAALNSAQNDL